MSDEQPYAVEAALRRHREREVHSPLGTTLTALLRSDGDRLAYFDSNRIIDHFEVQRRYSVGLAEQVVIEAAQWDPELSAAIGYEIQDLRVRPAESAWLVRGDGTVIDPARSRRPALAFFGIVLRHSETYDWTPESRHAVAEGNVFRLSVL